MPAYRLRFSLPDDLSSTDERRALLWTRSQDERRSFQTTIGPSLRSLGPVPRPNIEFVRLAAAVFAADRSTERQTDEANWSQRDIELTIPVYDPDRWEAISERLVPLMAFLTGDNWSLHFVRSRSSKAAPSKHLWACDRVVLLSGGADSAIGALLARHELSGRPYTLVSHFGSNTTASIQAEIASRIRHLIAGGDQLHNRIQLNRRRRRVDGSDFPNEYSTRSRSLLFLSLGLAVASIHGAELIVAENGFASINPPLGHDQRGTLSTRTTHPALIAGLRDVLPEAGVHADLRTPFAQATKGEMFKQAADLVGSEAASEFLSATHSCAHTGHRSHGLSIRHHCGVCFGCLVRRSAFLAAGLDDRTPYMASMERPDLRAYLAKRSMEKAMREFLVRGVDPYEIAALSLTSSYTASAAVEICRRACGELSLLWQ